MIQNSKIQVFLATHNRPEYIMDVIDSVLNQTFVEYELIISDNSNNNLTRNILESSGVLNLSNIRYVKREAISALQHLRKILTEVSLDYFMIFHDDDLMLPNMLQDLYCQFIEFPNFPIAAVGGNALLLKDDKFTNQTFMKTAAQTDRIISESPNQLALMYVNNNICPFDSYLYNSKVVKGVTFEEEKGGKYFDCSYLLDINCISSIIILTRPVMYLRLHTSQDSRAHSLPGRIKLLSHIKKVTENSIPHKKIKQFQLYNIYGQYCKKILNRHCEYFSRSTLKISILLCKYRRFDWLVKMHLKALIH